MALLHVVCLLGLLSRAWWADSETLQLSCSKQLGIGVPSNPKPPLKGKEPQVCVSSKTCCTKHTEDSLKARVVQQIKDSLLIKYRSAQSSLSSLFDDLQDYFQSVIREGRRQSSLFLLQMANNLTTAETDVISKFFKDLENYMVDEKAELKDIIVDSFFRDSFPLLLEHINPEGKTISSLYVECLKSNMAAIQPFGKRPAELVEISKQVFEPIRKLLSSLKFATEVLNMVQNFNFTSGCGNNLLKMKFCSLCQGHSEVVKPCHSLCMDTLRNCLTSEFQLQEEWETFIDAVSLLAGVIGQSNLENFSNTIYRNLWKAAMHVFIEKASVMRKVLIKCGTPTYIDASVSRTSNHGEAVSQTPLVDTRVFAKMENTKGRMEFLKTLYQDLPERLCVVDGLAAKQTGIEECWNGKALTKYTGRKITLTWFPVTPGDVKYLERLLTNLQTQTEAVKKYTKDKQDNDEDDDVDEDSSSGSGSGSGSGGNRIDGSVPCDRDDEDCGSIISGDINWIDEDVNPEGENKDGDIYFTGPGRKPNPTDQVQDGGIQNPSQNRANVNAHSSSSSAQESSLLQLLPLVVLVWFSINTSLKFGTSET